MLTLFGNLESGNVHKVQMILRRTRTPYCRVDVSQVRGEPKMPAFLRVNPMGKVPTVLLESGDALSESGAILYFFATGTELWPASQRGQTEVLRWMFFEQYSHEPALAVMRYLRLFTTEPSMHSARIRELEPRAHHALTVMEGQLGAQPWIAGEQCSIADYALYPYTRTADGAGLDIAEYPAIMRWMAQIENSPDFIPLGTDGAASSMAYADYFGESA